MNASSQLGYMPHGEGQAPALILPQPRALGPHASQRDVALHPAAAAAGVDVLINDKHPKSPSRPRPTSFPPGQQTQLSPSSGMLRSLNKRPTPRPYLPEKWAAVNPKRLTQKMQQQADKAKAESFYGMFDSDPEEDSGEPTGNAPGKAHESCPSHGVGGNSDGRPGREQDEETHQFPEEHEHSSLLLGPMGGLQQKLQSLAAGGSLESAGFGGLQAEPRQRGSVYDVPKAKQPRMRGAGLVHRTLLLHETPLEQSSQHEDARNGDPGAQMPAQQPSANLSSSQPAHEDLTGRAPAQSPPPKESSEPMGGPTTAAPHQPSSGAALQADGAGPAGRLEADANALQISAAGVQLASEPDVPQVSLGPGPDASKPSVVASEPLQKRASGQAGLLQSAQQGEALPPTPDRLLRPFDGVRMGKHTGQHAMQSDARPGSALQMGMAWAARSGASNPAQAELVRDLRDIIEELIDDLPLERRHHYQDRVHASLKQARQRQQQAQSLSAPQTPATFAPSMSSAPVQDRIPYIPRQTWLQPILPTPSHAAATPRNSVPRSASDGHVAQPLAINTNTMFSVPAPQPILAQPSPRLPTPSRPLARAKPAANAAQPPPSHPYPTYVESSPRTYHPQIQPHSDSASPAGKPSADGQPNDNVQAPQQNSASTITHPHPQPVPASLAQTARLFTPVRLAFRPTADASSPSTSVRPATPAISQPGPASCAIAPADDRAGPHSLVMHPPSTTAASHSNNDIRTPTQPQPQSQRQAQS